MKYGNIREEELKNSVAQDFFGKFDCTKIIKNIDFAVKNGETYLLWAEAKRNRDDILAMLAQLVLTIGKARTFDEILPPPFLGCYDDEKIAFVPYSEVQDIFYQNDFNWKVAPSDHETREFKQIYAQIEKTINTTPWQTYIFDFEKDEKELKRFIRENFVVGKMETSKIRIDKNNFITVYGKWLETVKPTIIADWALAKKAGIIDGDFYLADLLSEAQNDGYFTIKDKLSVLLKARFYETSRHVNEAGMFTTSRVEFSDNQKAHTQFWAKYERPPLEEYWDYIVDRRDLIVPQDVRERKGSFYTPKIWVELSQKYLSEVFGENWQDTYYVWDCAAGTGNLLAGLTNKNNIWASTLDKQDVDVMKDRIENGANLWEQQVFQFDFLNDDFLPISKGGKLPDELFDIISDENKRKRLIIYINPPYAEHGNRTTFAGKGEHKAKVSTTSKVYRDFQNIVGTATRELYAQFFLKIYKEIPDAKLASFSTPKFINAQNFLKFRNYFKASFLKGFICQANTFDNVNGHFPIGFLIWNLEERKNISKIDTDIIFSNADLKHCWQTGKKSFYAVNEKIFISDWLRVFYDKKNEKIGYLILPGVDMQQQNGVYITSQPTKSDVLQHKTTGITIYNIMEISIYLAVRQCIAPNWLNNRDQFLYPNDGWETDEEFQNNCLTYALFNNNISSKHGVNHWIPFTEGEVGSKSKFTSHFMASFLSGKIIQNGYSNLFEQEEDKFCIKREFSKEATSVFDAGRELWKYYHAALGTFPSSGVLSPFGEAGGGGAVNASLYDIREYFQGRNDKGTMNNKSDDETYNELIENLRIALKILAKKIEPKVYEYGFLKK
ncbi:MAG: hypothetical protein FWG84_03660 [Bacteroidales bacterium]|nr:hypothetical protein [Bacteroidales bacterium]